MFDPEKVICTTWQQQQQQQSYQTVDGFISSRRDMVLLTGTLAVPYGGRQDACLEPKDIYKRTGSLNMPFECSTLRYNRCQCRGWIRRPCSTLSLTYSRCYCFTSSVINGDYIRYWSHFQCK
jgi:hypothetical protein